MKMPQEEEKRCQFGAETHEVLSSKRALNSSSSFPNTPFTRTNAGRPPDRKCIRYMFSLIPKEHVEDGELWRRVGNALFNAGCVNKIREAERNGRLPGRVLKDCAQERGGQASYPTVPSNGTGMQSEGDAAAPDSSLHANPVVVRETREAPRDAWKTERRLPTCCIICRGAKMLRKSADLSKTLHNAMATHKGQVRFPSRRTCPFLCQHNPRPGDCGSQRAKGKETRKVWLGNRNKTSPMEMGLVSAISWVTALR